MLSAIRLVRREIKGIADGMDTKAAGAWLRQHGKYPGIVPKVVEAAMGKDLAGVVDNKRRPK